MLRCRKCKNNNARHAIKHIIKRHGADSKLAKQSGQPPINLQDIANHAEIINNADKRIISTDNNQRVLISGKQINGYFVVVETISTKDNELKLKTMYKEKGDLQNNKIFKSPLQDHKNGGKALVASTSNSLDKASGANAIPPQKTLFESLRDSSPCKQGSE
ncbi:hypothetical protein ACRE1U_04380 [Helicobacter himalayensis]|uniref:PBECR3 domain-containing polyvalent protein n=1 Tax=Helicobacter himalayensis TaxID=1591088 RepID=UPI003D6F04E5